jgi:uncharacterized protein
MLMAIGKSGFGGGLGALATPVLALMVSVPQAAAIMLPLLLAMDMMGIYSFRKDFDRKILKIILPAALLGTAIGALFFRVLDPKLIKLLLGIECVGFVVLRWVQAKAIAQAAPARVSVAKGWFWGTLSATASFISHAGSPPMLQFLLPLKLQRNIMVGTLTVFFTAVNFSKLLPYYWLGLLDGRNLSTSLALLPAAPVGFFIGRKLLSKISDKTFYRIMTWMLLGLGLKLIWDGTR